MAVIFPDYPDHGDGDWDVPLLTLLAQMIDQGNSHDVALALLGNNGTGYVSLSQNADGTWNLALTGLPTGAAAGAAYDGGTQY